MTELKTLKDLKHLSRLDAEMVRVDVLKAEAIKWIKELDREMDYYAWLHFFNITEDDLVAKGLNGGGK